MVATLLQCNPGVTPEENCYREVFANQLNLLVAKGGIEPPTQGFSVLCSTD